MNYIIRQLVLIVWALTSTSVSFLSEHLLLKVVWGLVAAIAFILAITLEDTEVKNDLLQETAE